MFARIWRARLGLLFFFGLAVPFVVPLSGQSQPESSMTNASGVQKDYHDEMLEGLQALKTNHPDSGKELFMDAYRQGLSRDSLYYFLSEAALTKFAYDTAMAFNLSIVTPRHEPFRQAVLLQRYKLYTQSGLDKDAKTLLDSMTEKPDSQSKRPKEFNWRLGSGYFRENNYSARDYPFGIDLGGFLSEGWQFQNQADLLWPVAALGSTVWTLGVSGESIKSYAKDSLDYRAGGLIRTKGFFSDSLSFTLSGDIGNVTGTGLVTSYKLESAYFAFSDAGLTMIQGGYESEWDRSWNMRFDGLWFSCYHDRSIRKGRGFNFSFTASAIRTDPTEDSSSLRIIYVDDVTKAKPTHYRNGDFQDSLPGSGISTFLKYSSATGTVEVSTRSSQTLVVLIPTLGYSFHLPWKFSGEAGGSYAFTYYPEAYIWQNAPNPVNFTAVSSGDFRGFALNRADGKEYAAIMLQKSGGFQEYYGPTPLSEKNWHRLDQQLGASLALRHQLSRWGLLAIEGNLKKNWTNLFGQAPVWIPDWDAGASLKWSRSWEWL